MDVREYIQSLAQGTRPVSSLPDLEQKIFARLREHDQAAGSARQKLDFLRQETQKVQVEVADRSSRVLELAQVLFDAARSRGDIEVPDIEDVVGGKVQEVRPQNRDLSDYGIPEKGGDDGSGEK